MRRPIPIRNIYRSIIDEDRRSRLMNERAIIGVMALTFGPLLVADLIEVRW